MRRKRSSWITIAYFWGLWIATALILSILPIKSKFQNFIETIMIIIAFIAIVSIVGIFWSYTPMVVLRHKPRKLMTNKKLIFIVYFSIIVSILGVAVVLWDRIAVRGIDYSLGLRNARYQWLNAGNVGSIWGKIGNIMIPFSYCALFMGIFHWENLKRYQGVFSILTGFAVQAAFAMINGGRSNILVSGVFAFSTCVLRKTQGKSFIPKIKGLAIYVALVIILLFSYVSSIFYAFADNDVDYLIKITDGLGAQVKEGYINNSNLLINTIIEIVLYILHGVYYVGAVILNQPQVVDINKNMSLRQVFVFAGRLHLIDYNMELPSFDGGGGNFVALPGILLYDYGYLGFIFTSVILGMLLGTAMKYMNRKSHNLTNFETVFCIVVLMHIYMSMIGMALGLGYFVFMVAAMILMEIIAGYRYGYSGWTMFESCCMVSGGNNEREN